MARVKAKGLSEEEKTQFFENEEKFGGDFMQFIKGVENSVEVEVAQVRRKYQSSFQDIDTGKFRIKHKLSQPDEIEPLEFSALKAQGSLDLEITLSDFKSGCEFFIWNDLPEPFRSTLQNNFKVLSFQFQSLFRTLKYIDSHIEELTRKAAKQVTKPPKPQSKSAHETVHHLEKEEQNTQYIVSEKRKRMQEYSKPTSMKLCGERQKMVNISSLSLEHCSLEVQCSKCSRRNLVQTSKTPETSSAGLNLLKFSEECECTRELLGTFEPKIVTAQPNPLFADITFQNCTPLDYRHSELKGSCYKCDYYLTLKGVMPHATYKFPCENCSALTVFRVENFDFSEEPIQITIKPSQRKEVRGNQPLPNKGTCKHYTKSFRWFRFPCCYRIFPCEKCHDGESDHKGERSNYMICGYCSLEQPVSGNDPCKRCVASLKTDTKTKEFWEGGKGCRDPSKLNRKDSRKYKRK